MSLVTVTLRPSRKISVALRVGGQLQSAVMPDRLAVLIGARQVIEGPPGPSGMTRTYYTNSVDTLTPDANLYDAIVLSGQNRPVTIAAPVLTSKHYEIKRLIFRIDDNGDPQPITWDRIYNGFAYPLPATTLGDGKVMWLGFAWFDRSDGSHFDLLAVSKPF